MGPTPSTMMASGNRDRSRRRRLGLSPPTGVPGVAGPGRAASLILLPRNGHLLHRGLWFGCCPHVWRCRSGNLRGARQGKDTWTPLSLVEKGLPRRCGGTRSSASALGVRCGPPGQCQCKEQVHQESSKQRQ